MKVLHLFNEIKFSGAEIMYANAASYFKEQGVDMLAFNTGAELGDFVPEFEQNGIKVFHFPLTKRISFSFKFFKDYLNFFNFLKKEKIEVLHIHRSDLFLVAFIARFAHVSSIKTMHNVFKNRKTTYLYGYLKRLIARKISKVCFHTIGESVYENELNYYKNPSIRINNWYDPNRFFPQVSDNEKLAVRERLGIEPEAFVVSSVGGCSHVKNHCDIIRAMQILNQKAEGFLYLHLGKGSTEKDEQELARSFGLSDKICFVGNRHNVRDYLIASDVYLMPSKFEGLSISSLEAMACGLPSVLYNSVGLRDLITDDNNGFLIDHDYEVMADKVLFLREHPSLAEKMAQQALIFVNSEFSISKSVNLLVDLYKHN